MQGKVVLVTGANGGLGAHVTQAFLDARATVIGTSRKNAAIQVQQIQVSPHCLRRFRAAKVPSRWWIKLSRIWESSMFSPTLSAGSLEVSRSRTPTMPPSSGC